MRKEDLSGDFFDDDPLKDLSPDSLFDMSI
jgi:hypothetical protein